jgi:hypothetical protein
MPRSPTPAVRLSRPNRCGSGICRAFKYDRTSATRQSWSGNTRLNLCQQPLQADSIPRRIRLSAFRSPEAIHWTPVRRLTRSIRSRCDSFAVIRLLAGVSLPSRSLSISPGFGTRITSTPQRAFAIASISSWHRSPFTMYQKYARTFSGPNALAQRSMTQSESLPPLKATITCFAPVSRSSAMASAIGGIVSPSKEKRRPVSGTGVNRLQPDRDSELSFRRCCRWTWPPCSATGP